MYKTFLKQKQKPKKPSNLLTENTQYKQVMIKIFQKAIKDEMFSAVAYTRIAESIKGFQQAEIAEMFKKHAKEESGDHFYELMEYASGAGIINELCIKFDFSGYDMPVDFNLETIYAWKQNLENDAYMDYINASNIARNEGDIITAEFFRELAKDEKGHIQDLLDYTDIGSELIKF